VIDTTGLAAWLRLTLIPGIGGETQRKLLAAFGLPEAIFAAGRLEVRASSATSADLLFDFDPARKPSSAAWPGPASPASTSSPWPMPAIRRPCWKSPIHPACSTCAAIRHLLHRNADWPWSAAAMPPRRALQTAETLPGHLAAKGLCHHQRPRLGIDAAAHRGALAAGGETIAVIGTGADRIYPARNKELAWRLPNAAPSFPNFRSARRPSPPIFPAATASFPACRAACWSSKRPRRAAR
jgi:DNA processing protein